ncbi:MAG: neutral/alkaline non-lysosomal ceramidase N-terminal domain-containing protein, partial [Planctomycetota bacterium]
MQRIQALAAALVVAVAFSHRAHMSSAQPPPLRVGFAKIDITPDVEQDRPVRIAGYGQNRRAVGVHDPLYAIALVLSDGERTVALASVDLIGLQLQDVQRIRDRLQRFDYVLVSSTHNHEGPDVIGIWGPNPITSGVDAEYVDAVVQKTADCIREAASDLKPADASYGTAIVPDEWLRDSRLPIVRDDTLRVVMFRDPGDQRPVVLLVQYSCHPETLGSRNTQITADFPFATLAALRERYDCPIAYFTGAVGGLMSNPSEFTDAEGQVYNDGTFAYADAYGKSIADLVVQAVEGSEPVDMTPMR